MSMYGDAARAFIGGYTIGTNVADRRTAKRLTKEHLDRAEQLKSAFAAFQARQDPTSEYYQSGAAEAEAPAAPGAPAEATAIPEPTAAAPAEAPAAAPAPAAIPEPTAAAPAEAPTQAAIPEPVAATDTAAAAPQAPAPAAPARQMNLPKRSELVAYRNTLFSYIIDEGGTYAEAMQAVDSMDSAMERKSLQLFSAGVEAASAGNMPLAAQYLQGAYAGNPDGLLPLVKIAPDGKTLLVQPVDEESMEPLGPLMPFTVEQLRALEQGLTMDAKSRMEGRQQDRELTETERKNLADEGLTSLRDAETKANNLRQDAREREKQAQEAAAAGEKAVSDRLTAEAAIRRARAAEIEAIVGGGKGGGSASEIRNTGEVLGESVQAAGESANPVIYTIGSDYAAEMNKLLAAVWAATDRSYVNANDVIANVALALSDMDPLWERDERGRPRALKEGVAIKPETWQKLTDMMVQQYGGEYQQRQQYLANVRASAMNLPTAPTTATPAPTTAIPVPTR